MAGKKQVKKMFKKGWNDEEIAYKLGITEKEVFRIRRENYLLKDEEIDQILKTRRKIIIGAGLLLTSAALGGIGYLHREQILEVKDRLLNPNIASERQQKLDELVKNYPCHYTQHIYYDHDGSLITKFPSKLADMLLSNPAYMRVVEDLIISEYEKRGYPKTSIENFLKNPDAKRMLEDVIRKSFGEELELYVPGEPAAMPFYTPLFGRGLKSDIYFFKSAFQNEKREIMRKTIEIPLQLRLKVIYMHECFHAKQFYEGIKMNKGLTLDSSNFKLISPAACNFITESAAYIDTYESFRDSEKNLVGQLYSAVKMAGFILAQVETLKKYRLTALETQFIGIF